MPFKLNVSKLSKEFNINLSTLYNYIDILEETGIFRIIKKFSRKTTKKPEKILFANPNIIYSFSEEYGIGPNIGTIRESFFVSNFNIFTENGDFIYNDIIFEIGCEKRVLIR